MSAEELITLARAANATIATAESCTGGLVGGAITEVPGASDVFDHGCITYSNEAKVRLLGVLPETLERHGAVSEEIAREMVEGVLATSDATLAVAITGVAGPGGSDAKPEGYIWFATSLRRGKTMTDRQNFGAIGRSAVRAAATDHAIRLLIDRLR